MILPMLRSFFPYSICLFLYGAFAFILMGLAGPAGAVVQAGCAAFAGLVAIFALRRSAYAYYVIAGVFLALLVFAYASTGFNPASQHNFSKLTTFSAVLGFSALVGIYLSYYSRLDRFVSVLAYMSLTITFGLYFFRYDPAAGRLGSEGANPIWVARLAGVFILYAFIGSLYNQRQKHKLLLALGAMAVLLLTGSRGPLVSLVLTVVAFFAVSRGGGSSKLIALSVFTLSVVGAVFVLPDQMMERILMSGANGRDYLYTVAWELFQSNMWGWGVGGFVYQTHLPPSLSYPHNLILELLVETGLAFTCLLAALLIYAVYCSAKLVRVGSNMTHGILAAIMWFALLNSMFSGDMTSPKELYLLAFYFICDWNRRKRALKSQARAVVQGVGAC